jgi:hypothetical protein
MTRFHKQSLNATRIVAFALLVLIVPASRSQAQGYGYGAYGYPGYGYGYGGPGFGYGYGAGYGYGYPVGGYYGYGGAFGFGLGVGYSYPPVSYNYFGNGYPGVQAPLVSGVGDLNPLFGLGLTPLGVQSALAERNLINASRPRNPGISVGAGVPGKAASDQYSGTGSARPR